MVECYDPQIKKRKIVWRETQDTIPHIRADHNALLRAYRNLVDNAIKYTDSGGEVVITLRMDAKQFVVIEVRDNGAGISPVDLPRLFERFYRGASRKTLKERGSGLGLAIVKSIAERHHGTVVAESRLGKGSIFTLRIPVNQPKE